MGYSSSHLLITQEGFGSVGTIRNLTDTFTTLDATKWTASDGNVTIVSGTAQIATTSSYSNLTSNAIYDARNAITSIEVLQAPNVGNGTTSAFMLLTGLGTSQRLRVGVEGGVLNAGYDPGTGSWTSLASTSYNATAHKIWRVRESGGQLYIETSSNGASWSILSGPVTTPIGFATVKVVLNSGYYGTEPSAGVAQFDNFNATYVDPPPAPRVFYVSNTGADTNDGLSTGAPFQTVAKVNALSLYPGDQILFQCGGTWAEALTIAGSGTSTSPITVSSYDTGAQPIFNGGGSSGVAGVRHLVEVYGSFVTLNNLEARGSQLDDFLLNGPDGIIQNCTARWGTHGIHQGNLGSRAQILNNTCINVNVEVINPGTDDDGGSMSVLLEGDGAVVTGNTMSGANAYSPDYGTDGSAVEVYNATNVTIAYNYATDCQTFFEAGGTNAQNILIHHNVSTTPMNSGSIWTANALADANGAVIHGSDSYGPVLGVQIYHNTFVVTGGGVNGSGVWASAGAGVDLQNNIIVALGSSQIINIGGTITEAGNVLYGGGTAAYTFPQGLDATSTIADPKFINPYTDLRIPDTSPAVDRGADLGYNTDYSGKAARGTVLDSGAYEASAFVVPVADTATTTDSAAQTVAWARTAADAAATADAVTVVAAVTSPVADAAPAADTAAQTVTYSRAVNDTVAAADAAGAASGSSQSAADTAPAADAAAVAVAYTRTVADTGAAADSAATTATYSQTVTDTAGAVDTVIQPVSTLTTDFTAMPSFFDANYGGAFINGSGQAETPTIATYSGFSTSGIYALTGSSVYAQIVTASGLSGTRQNSIKCIVDANNSVEMLLSGGVFKGRVQAGGTNTDATLATYSATTHAWWRMRESAGTIFWDTSPDGTTWTNLSSATHGLNLGRIVLRLQAGYFGTAGSEVGAPNAVYDNLNTPAVAVNYSQTIPDTAAAADSAAAAASYAPTITDTAGAVDSQAFTTTYAPSIADLGAATDSATTAATYTRAVTDSGAAVDSVQAASSDSASVADAAATADSTATSATYSQAITDAGATADATSTSVTKFLADTAGAVDAASTASTYTQTVTDTGGATDATASSVATALSDAAAAADAVTTAAAYAQSPADTAGAVDAATQTASYAPTVADTAGAVDATQSVAADAVTLADPVAAADAVTSATSYVQAVADTAGAVDVASSTVTKVVADTAAAADAASAAASYAAAIADPAAAADAIASGVGYAQNPADTAGAVDATSITASYAPTLADTALAADAIQVSSTGGGTLSDAAPAADTVTATVGYTQTVTDTATAVDAASSSVTKTVADTGAAVDAVTSTAGYAPAVADAAGAADATAAAAGYASALADTAGSVDSASSASAAAAAVADTGPATDSASSATSYTRLVADIANAADIAQAAGSGGIQVSDAAPVADTVTPASATSLAQADSAGATDTISVAVDRAVIVADTATATDSVTPARALGIVVLDVIPALDAVVTDQSHGDRTVTIVDAAGVTDTVTQLVAAASQPGAFFAFLGGLM